MSGPAYDHEGPLGDREVQRKAQQAQRRARLLLGEDMAALAHDEHFLRWASRHLIPILLRDIETTNGGDLQQYMGQRKVALTMLDELEEHQTGALERLLTARRNYETDLLRQEPPEKEQ